MKETGLERRTRRALERGLAFQREKARAVQGHEDELVADMIKHSRAVRDALAAMRPIPTDARVLEVGSGAHGLIFFFEGGDRIGVDPLADHYRVLFPEWQGKVRTIAAFGEQLPFEDGSFDIVLCDNVVDHAQDPQRIVEELARVLAPGGLLYFTVNVHHPVYHWAATVHAAWRAVGLPFEITPFADHTYHLTRNAARRLFAGLPLQHLSESEGVEAARRESRQAPARHAGDLLKRLFFKNARWELIAVKEGNPVRSGKPAKPAKRSAGQSDKRRQNQQFSAKR